MKNLFKTIVICGLFALIGGITASCTQDMDEYKGPPVMEIGEANVISAVRVEIPLNAKKMTSVGYKVVEVVEGQEPTAPANAQILFRTGNKIDGSPKTLVLTGNDGLDRDKSFVVYIAATISSTEFYNNGEIFSVEFTTPKHYADDEVFVKSTNSEGATVVVQFPEKVRQKNRRIKWGVANIAMLNYYGKKPIPEQLYQNDNQYPAYLIKADTVLEINHHNAYRRNANGEIGYYYFAGYTEDGVVIVKECDKNDPRVDTGEAEPTQYYQHFQPGEPIVIMMSEVDYAGCKEIAKLEGDEYVDHILADNCGEKHPMIDWSWGPGWYWYPYDYQAYVNAIGSGREPGDLPDMGMGGGSNKPTVDFDKFWHDGAWYRRFEVELPGPKKLETGSVEINTSALETDGGKIVCTPTGDTYAYFVGIYPETSEIGAGYNDLLDMLDGKAQYLQWLTTAEIAPYLSIYPYEGTQIFNLKEMIYEIEGGKKYHMLVNAVKSKYVDGDFAIDVSQQNFQHITFQLPDYKLPAPELIVTAYDAYSTNKVRFNIKNPNYETMPVKDVVYTANDSRTFASYMAAMKYTYTDMVMMNYGYSNLEEHEVAQVNSEFGFDIEFDKLRDDSELTIAVMGWNMEGRPSNPDKEGTQAVAEAHTKALEAADALDMTKLNTLKGDWTATADIKTINFNTGEVTASTKSWKVSIGELKTDNTLSAADYKIFEEAGVNKESADAYLAEFNKLSAEYNTSVLNQNRILCQGWDLSGQRETSTASPWNLFTMSDYNASKVDYLFDDFGPKWFLQTDANGNIFVPVNYNIVPPMMSWYNGMDHFFCSGNYEKGIANYVNTDKPTTEEEAMDVKSVGIPVEISEDGNTITLKSVVVNTTIENVAQDVTLYPTVIYDNQGSLAFYNPYVVSEVVLTRGWNGGATPAPTKLATGKYGFSKRVANSENFKTPVKAHSRTALMPSKSNEGNVVTRKLMTKEEMRKGLDEYMSRFNKGARK